MNKWKKRFLIVLFCLSTAFFVSCATNGWIHKKIYKYSLRPYVKEFSERSGIPMSNLETIDYSIVLFLPANTAAQCVIPKIKSARKAIQVRWDIFLFSSELQKKAIIFHEILHCYCGRKHTILKGSYWEMFGWTYKKTNNKGDCPLSIMYPSLLSSECLNQNWEEYMEEAFSFCPKDLSIFFQ
jgi:hypothetical protein